MVQTTDGFIIAAVGRLSPEKNLSALVDAFSTIAADDRTTTLLIVGGGPELDALQARARAAGIGDRVVFAGVRSDMDRVYPVIDCLALPSLTEGMPLVVLEAMARGIPIVASAVGDVPRLLAQTDAGRIVARPDVDALAVELSNVVARGKSIDERARRYIAGHHLPDAMARAYAAIYQPLLANEHGRKAS